MQYLTSVQICKSDTGCQPLTPSHYQALNEELCIREAVEKLLRLKPPPCEIIVVDGGSTDRYHFSQ